MLIEKSDNVEVIKINPTFRPSESSYPHYRLVPMVTETGKYWYLLFYVSENRYLMLEPRIKRYQAMQKLSSGYLTTAPYPVFEVINK